MRALLGAAEDGPSALPAKPDPGTVATLAGRAPPVGCAPAAAPRRIALLPEVMPFLRLFRHAERCLRYPPLGGPPLGFDWPQLQAIAAGMGIPWDGTAIELMAAAEAEATGIWLADWKRRHPQRGT